jgi:hypothetical protein
LDNELLNHAILFLATRHDAPRAFPSFDWRAFQRGSILGFQAIAKIAAPRGEVSRWWVHDGLLVNVPLTS